jgi:SAM-dependent methyltransferase
VNGPQRDAAQRRAREIEHHREIADRAEIVWNWDSPSGARRADRRARLFCEGAALGPGRRALELGCGTGVFLRRVGRHGARIVGLDLSKQLLGKAREQAATLANVRLLCGDAERLPFPDGCFDAVYGSSVLHHLTLENAAREVFRVLRPGGRAVFTEPNILNPQVAFMFHVGLTKRYFGVSPDEMAFSRFRALITLQDVGFRPVQSVPFDFLHPATPPGWLDRVERLGRWLERLPFVNEIAGSQLILAQRP